MTTTALRHFVLSALAVGTTWAAAFGIGKLLASIADDADTGNSILVGLGWFGSLVVVASLGGLLSGRSLGFGPAVAIWGVIGVLLAVAMPLQTATETGSFDRDVFLSDLTALGPFLATLVVAPATVCAALSLLARPRPPHQPVS